MNKINLFKLALVVVLSTAASASFSYGATISGSTLLGGNSFSPSNNVDVYVATDGDGSTNQGFDGNNYSAKSKHQKGDKTIGCLSNDPKLYFYAGTSTSDTSHVTPATSDTYSGTDWTSM